MCTAQQRGLNMLPQLSAGSKLKVELVVPACLLAYTAVQRVFDKAAGTWSELHHTEVPAFESTLMILIKSTVQSARQPCVTIAVLVSLQYKQHAMSFWLLAGAPLLVHLQHEYPCA
jgi:hypothetical protein